MLKILIRLTLLIFFSSHASNSLSSDLKIEDILQSCQKAEFETKLVIDDILCLRGEIKLEPKILSMVEDAKIKTIVVRSKGGDVEYSIDLALAMTKSRIDLIVDGYCFSSCANYVFLAANRKYVPHFALIAWHGAPKQLNDAFYKEKLSKDVNRIKMEQARMFNKQTTLFSLLKLNQDIIEKPPKSVMQSEFYQQLRKNAPKGNWAWTIGPKRLQHEFGVTGIVEMSYDSPENMFKRGQLLSKKLLLIAAPEPDLGSLQLR